MKVLYAERYAEGLLDALESLSEGGEVVATYRRTMNIRTASGRLIGIQVPGTALGPFGIALRTNRPVAWPSIGTACSLQGQHLTCGPLMVDLGFMHLAVPPRIPDRGDTWSPTPFIAVLRPFAVQSSIPVDLPTRSNIANQHPLTHSLRRLAELVQLESLASQQDLKAFTRLIGWGPGATPSGDDFLIGFFGAWSRLATRDAPSGGFLEEMASLASSTTTPLAAEFYLHLAEGRLSEPINTLLFAIGMDDRQGVELAAGELARFGASSGFDTIAGIQWYLRVCID